MMTSWILLKIINCTAESRRFSQITSAYRLKRCTFCFPESVFSNPVAGNGVALQGRGTEPSRSATSRRPVRRFIGSATNSPMGRSQVRFTSTTSSKMAVSGHYVATQAISKRRRRQSMFRGFRQPASLIFRGIGTRARQATHTLWKASLSTRMAYANVAYVGANGRNAIGIRPILTVPNTRRTRRSSRPTVSVVTPLKGRISASYKRSGDRKNSAASASTYFGRKSTPVSMG